MTKITYTTLYKLKVCKLKKTYKAVPRSFESDRKGGKTKRVKGRGSNLCIDKFIFSTMPAFIHKL